MPLIFLFNARSVINDNYQKTMICKTFRNHYTLIIRKKKSRVGFYGGSRGWILRWVLRRRRDWILRCPYFCSPMLVASTQKSDRCNSNGSLHPSPTALAVVPLAYRSVSNPFGANRKDRQMPVFLFGGEGSLPSVSHTLFINYSLFPRDFSNERIFWEFLIAKIDT